MASMNGAAARMRPGGTVTFLFTDIEGSTRSWEQSPEAMTLAHSRQEAIIRSAVGMHSGLVYKMVGDAFQAAFDSAKEALEAAAGAQRSLYAEAWSLPSPLRVRMIVHTAVVEQREDDYVGPALNRAGRLLAAGYGGQILLTSASAELVKETLPAGVNLRDLGEHRLRDLMHSEHIYQALVDGLPSDFPPLKTLGAHPNNLPLSPTPLVGREQAVAGCVALLAQPDVRLLTLTGPGGIGKTRLALHVAAQVLDRFEDGVFLVSLANTRDPGLVASTIIHALGLTEAPGMQAADILLDYVRRKSLLLVLDNMEQVLAAGDLVALLLSSASNLRILVTSRSTLSLSAEHEYPVQPMSLAPSGDHLDLKALASIEAIALFVERAQAVQPAFRLTAGTRPISPVSAPSSTGCLWPSKWRRRACVSSPRTSCWAACGTSSES